MAQPKLSKGRKAPTTPPALVKRAKAAHAARLTRLAAQGRDAIGAIRAARSAVATNYFSMGEALAVLQGSGMAEALGRKDFAEVCTLDLDMAERTAEQLIALVKRLSRTMLETLGRERANAMLALVDATPADDAVGDVLGATINLPSGEKLVVRDASTAEIYAAAKAFRDARAVGQTKRSPGFTTTPDERARFAKSAKHWQRKDVKDVVTTRLVASRKEHGALVRVELPLAVWERLRPPPRG